MISRTQKAQSILEYVIVLTAIVGAIILSSGNLNSKVQEGMRSASDSMLNSLNGNPSIKDGPTTPTDNPADPNTPPALTKQLFDLLGIPDLKRPDTSSDIYKYNSLATEYEVTSITSNTEELKAKYNTYLTSNLANPSFPSQYAAYQATLNDLQKYGYITMNDRKFEKK